MWERDLEEIASGTSGPATDTDVMVTDLVGYGPAHPGLRRRGLAHSLGADVTVPLSVGKGVVVAMDRGGKPTALDEAGSARWTKELEGEGRWVRRHHPGGAPDQTAHGLDPASGDRRWLRPFFGTFTEVAFPRRPAGAGHRECHRPGRRGGRVTARLPGYLRLTSSADWSGG